MIEVGSSTRWTRCLQRLSLSTVATKTNGREATPTLGASARRFLCGWRRGKEAAAVLVALALLGAQAADDRRDSQSGTIALAIGASDVFAAASRRPTVPAASRRLALAAAKRRRAGPTATCRRAVAAE